MSKDDFNLAELLYKQIQHMTTEEKAAFRRNLAAILPMVIDQAAELARADARELRAFGNESGVIPMDGQP